MTEMIHSFLVAMLLLILTACGSERPAPDAQEKPSAPNGHLFETQEKVLRDAEKLEQSLQDAAQNRLDAVDSDG